MENNLEKKEILEIVGNNIKIIRKSKGMTQEVFAEKLGKSINYVSLVELGKSGIGMTTLIEICNILDIDSNSIFKGLLTYNMKEKDKYILENISTFSDNDKNMVMELMNYIVENKK